MTSGVRLLIGYEEPTSGIGMWRVSSLDQLGRLDASTPLLVAAYSADDLESAARLFQAQPTIVIGVGLGPRLGPRALTLGVLAYCEAETDPAALRQSILEGIGRAGARSR